MKQQKLDWQLLLLLMSLVFLSTCTKVDRVNPFDDKTNLSPEEWAPDNLNIEDISITNKKLTWSYNDKNIEGFKLERRTNNGIWESPLKLIAKELRSYIDTTILPDTGLIYEYRLYAYAAANQSEPMMITSKAIFPEPTELKIEKYSDVRYNLSWKDNCKGEEGYRIDKRIGDNPWQIGFKSIAANQISYTDSNVFRSMELEYRVYAFYKTFTSEKITSNTTCDLPAPSALQITVNSPSIAILNWIDNSNGEEGFMIKRQANGGNWEVLATVPSNIVTFQDNDFSLISNVLYRVSAISGQFTTQEIEASISIPTVITGDALNITVSTAQCDGSINGTDIGQINERGICYSTSLNPTIENTHVSEGSGGGPFMCQILSLTENNLYNYRAYAITSSGIFYGVEKSFSTLQITIPIVTTSAVSNITQISAIGGGNITYDGGSNIIAKGVCWSIIQNPSITDSYTTDGTGTELFISSLTGLTVNTLYYVRAYATNSLGTGYGNNFTFSTSGVVDFDGNIYNTVIIGTQEWMAENLKVTHYRNGEPITNVTDDTQWSGLTSGAFCWYDNDKQTYGDTYGALYNWFTVIDNRNLCPLGWHIPSDAECTTLTTYLGGESVSGTKLKSTTGWYNDGNGTNESGFTGLPGGGRFYYGTFYGIVSYSGYWKATENDFNDAWRLELGYGGPGAGTGLSNKKDGFSIRCVKD